MVHQIDSVKIENLLYGYTLIVKNTSTYYTKCDREVKGEQVKAGKERSAGLFKAVKGYLVANPDAYNYNNIANLYQQKYFM